MIARRCAILFSVALGISCSFSIAQADTLKGHHRGQNGIASIYAYKGGKTANGERVSANALTAAHRTLPFGTRVKVTNVKNGRSVVVRINDRGPFVKGRVIDLTPSGASALGFSQKQGLAQVSLAVVD